MSNAFVNQAMNIADRTITENGANSYRSTGEALVDAFGVIGALRGADEARIEKIFSDAFAEDKLLAMKLLFYARNIRGIGLGERNTFRVILRYLAMVHPEVVIKNIHNIPYYGRWDDLWCLVGTECEDAVFDLVRKQYHEDLDNFSQGKPVSIMAKWIKSPNTKNKDPLPDLIMKQLGETNYKEYKTKLHALRCAIDVVEIKMSENRWDYIDYEAVPARAMKRYRNAFERHGASFKEYVKKVESGEAKINASTLYPYDIFESMGLKYPQWDFSSFFAIKTAQPFRFERYDKVAEEQWKALPNYVEDGANILVMADTSGSMGGRPIYVSLSLAMYFAERNTGPFKNVFMTFSDNPEYVHLTGDTLYDKIKCVHSIVSSTNLEKAFKLVLDTAITGNVPPEDMPKAIVVISDMEINRFNDQSSWGFLENMRCMFRSNGYEMPNVVMWNVASRHDNYLAKSKTPGVQFASGASASTFKSLINNVGKSAKELMLNTLNDPIFDRVVV